MLLCWAWCDGEILGGLVTRWRWTAKRFSGGGVRGAAMRYRNPNRGVDVHSIIVSV